VLIDFSLLFSFIVVLSASAIRDVYAVSKVFIDITLCLFSNYSILSIWSVTEEL
jgi:hypothetical protein